MKPHRPLIETWYEGADGEIFEVLAVDDEAIEIQYVDGSVEELDREAWEDVSPRKIAPPHEALLGEDDGTERPVPRGRRDETRSRYYDEWAHDLDHGQEDEDGNSR